MSASCFPQAPTCLLFVLMHSPGGSEDLFGVGADCINGTVVAFDLSDGGEVIHVPHLEHARPAGTEEHGSPGHERQSAHPVLVGVGDLLWGWTDLT